MSEGARIANTARKAFSTLRLTPASQRSAAVGCMAGLLLEHQEEILAANREDIHAAALNGLSEAMIDRLSLSPARIKGIADDLKMVAQLPDPVGEVIESRILPNGLRLRRERVPLGVILVIYESRPNVTMDTAALCLKSGNCVILRGGKETVHSNEALTFVIRKALAQNDLPQDAVISVTNPDRALMLELMQQDESIALLIPRGGAGLHNFCRQNSRIPVVTGGIGVCHLYAAASADQEKSLDVVFNAKVQRPSTCNALETLLVDRSIAGAFLPKVVEKLGSAGVTFRADEDAMWVVGGMPGVQPAQEGDFDKEWLSLILGLKVVNNLDQALGHIAEHGTSHSDGILSEDRRECERFLHEVDSAAVYVNASTRFTDGAQFGLGAEVAVSTQRIQARGPMGLRDLTTYKWIAEGEYHTRD